ncbi:MAG: hypothetical protein Q4A93_04650 [Actinomycetota bacterium]|nr:hypothetical protein [Actinomycetota bacterium]
MKSTDERMNDVFGRAKAREAATRRRRQRIAGFAGGALCVIAVALVGIGVALVVAESAGPSALVGQLGLMGSVIADASAAGCIAIGLAVLVVGAAVSVLAYRMGRPASKGADVHGKGRSS